MDPRETRLKRWVVDRCGRRRFIWQRLGLEIGDQRNGGCCGLGLGDFRLGCDYGLPCLVRGGAGGLTFVNVVLRDQIIPADERVPGDAEQDLVLPCHRTEEHLAPRQTLCGHGDQVRPRLNARQRLPGLSLHHHVAFQRLNRP